VEKGWRFALKTCEASRLYNSIGEIETVAKRLRNVYIDRLDFRRCLKNWDSPTTFFYADPPYYDTTPYRKGIKQFTATDHEDLADLLRLAKGKWLLTLNEHLQIHQLYRGFVITPVDTQMATWKGPRGSKRPRFRQLIIRNYNLRAA
jgi:DNA adenine methylase